jgi:hypothetical protein
MNIVKIYGGLGNQLFQYAFGHTLEHHGHIVRYDLSWFNGYRDETRPYRLNKFYTIVHPLPRMKGTIINEVKTGYVKNMNYLTMDNCYFYGYWQHPGYFQEILPKLYNIFKVTIGWYTEEYMELREKIILNQSTSIHVRRGDYLQANGHYLLGLDYYRNALDSIKDKGDIYVFSDDLPWCGDKFENATLVHLPDYLSFDLMRLCNNNIIANSTFSWWAAYLNQNIDKQVITPIQWRKDINDPAMTDMDFMCPAGWTRLESPGRIVCL